MSYVMKKNLILITISVLSFNCLSIEPERMRIPILSGTAIKFPRDDVDSDCTVGLVLKKTGFWDNATPYRKAVRYALTAAHCGRTDEEAYVASQIVGKVVWKSQLSDLELIRIEPYAQHFRRCSAPSTGLTCSIGIIYTERAKGRVILTNPRRGLGDISIPVTGTGSAGINEVFCTSGQVTNWNCSWGSTDTPPGWVQQRVLEKTAETFGPNVQFGDSGGPVVSSAGRIYGIISARGEHWSNNPNKMQYTDIQQFFTEQHGYAVAPP